MEAEVEIMMQKETVPLPIIKMDLYGITAKELELVIEPMANLLMITNQIFRF